MKGSASDGRPSPVVIHLPGGCRKRRKRATSTDPRATSCRDCLKSKRWRRTARSMIRAANRGTTGQPTQA